jgi:hypothetical protein
MPAEVRRSVLLFPAPFERRWAPERGDAGRISQQGMRASNTIPTQPSR